MCLCVSVYVHLNIDVFFDIQSSRSPPLGAGAGALHGAARRQRPALRLGTQHDAQRVRLVCVGVRAFARACVLV